MKYTIVQRIVSYVDYIEKNFKHYDFKLYKTEPWCGKELETWEVCLGIFDLPFNPNKGTVITIGSKRYRVDRVELSIDSSNVITDIKVVVDELMREIGECYEGIKL